MCGLQLSERPTKPGLHQKGIVGKDNGSIYQLIQGTFWESSSRFQSYLEAVAQAGGDFFK